MSDWGDVINFFWQDMYLEYVDTDLKKTNYLRFSGILEAEATDTTDIAGSPYGTGVVLNDHMVNQASTATFTGVYSQNIMPQIPRPGGGSDGGLSIPPVIPQLSPVSAYENIDKLRRKGTMFDIYIGYIRVKSCMIHGVRRRISNAQNNLELTLMMRQILTVGDIR